MLEITDLFQFKGKIQIALLKLKILWQIALAGHPKAIYW